MLPGALTILSTEAFQRLKAVTLQRLNAQASTTPSLRRLHAPAPHSPMGFVETTKSSNQRDSVLTAPAFQ